LVRVIPWSFHFTRGSCSLLDLADELTSLGINRLVILHEKKGNPSLFKFYKLEGDELDEKDYRMRLKGISLARELNRGRSKFISDSRLMVVNKCHSDFGEQLYMMLSMFFGFERMRTLPSDPQLKGIAINFSDKNDMITLEFQQIESKEMIGPRLTISDVYLGKKGEAIKSLMNLIGLGKKPKKQIE
jgi:rRNA maturation protein Rpf1